MTDAKINTSTLMPMITKAATAVLALSSNEVLRENVGPDEFRAVLASALQHLANLAKHLDRPTPQPNLTSRNPRR